MTALWPILTAVGFSLHIFVVMMKTGANQANVAKKQIVKIAIIFAGIQILLQFLGIIITWEMEQFRGIQLLNRLYRFLILVILIKVSIDCLQTACKKEENFTEHREEPLTLPRIALISARAGGTAVILGMNLYYCRSFPDALLVVFLSMVSAICGFSLGYWYGVTGERLISAVSGGMMALLATTMLFAS